MYRGPHIKLSMCLKYDFYGKEVNYHLCSKLSLFKKLPILSLKLKASYSFSTTVSWFDRGGKR